MSRDISFSLLRLVIDELLSEVRLPAQVMRLRDVSAGDTACYRSVDIDDADRRHSYSDDGLCRCDVDVTHFRRTGYVFVEAIASISRQCCRETYSVMAILLHGLLKMRTNAP